MSVTLNFFKEHPSWDDNLHKILAKISGYEAQLLPVRQQMLSCCGASQGKNGEIKLTVADVPRWDALTKQLTEIDDKIGAINRMVAELDTIFAEIAAAGIEIHRKTVTGIWNAVPRTEAPPQRGEYRDAFGRRVGEDGRPLKSIEDPTFLRWAERAEATMRGL